MKIINPKDIKYIKWWERILLWFLPTTRGLDATKELIVELEMKQWRGKTYITKEHYTDLKTAER